MSNKCDHDINNFKHYARPAHYKKPPTQIENLITAFYYVCGNAKSDFNLLIKSLIKSKRNRRSERKEVYQGVIQFLINHYDMVSEKITKFTIKDIAHWCGFSVDRVRAVIEEMKQFGLIATKTFYAISGPNQIKTTATEITMKSYFFDIIGYSHAKLHEAKAYRMKKKFAEKTKEIMKRASEPMKKVLDVFTGKTTKPQEEYAKKEIIRRKQNASAKMAELGITTSNPDWKILCGWPE